MAGLPLERSGWRTWKVTRGACPAVAALCCSPAAASCGLSCGLSRVVIAPRSGEGRDSREAAKQSDGPPHQEAFMHPTVRQQLMTAQVSDLHRDAERDRLALAARHAELRKCAADVLPDGARLSALVSILVSVARLDAQTANPLAPTLCLNHQDLVTTAHPPGGETRFVAKGSHRQEGAPGNTRRSEPSVNPARFTYMSQEESGGIPNGITTCGRK